MDQANQEPRKTKELSQQYEDLLECLDGLVKVYRTLLETVRREKEILIASQLDDLTENNKAKDAMLVKIRSLELCRIGLATELARAVGADHESPRLLEIANRSTLALGDRLRSMHNVLDLLVKRVAEVNKQNEELVQSALTTITGAMEAIRDGLKPKATYGSKGKMADASKDGGHLVRKEV